MWSRSLVIMVLAVSTLAGCTAERQVSIDLIERFPEADTFTETTLIDVGEPLGRPYLLDGWLPGDEHWSGRRDESFVWATGNEATFRFFAYEARDLAIVVRARPNLAPTAEPMTSLGMELNGVPVSRPEVAPGWQSYRALLPRQIVRPGENRIGLILGDGRGGTATDRRLAVDRIDLERTITTYPARQELGEPALIIPYLSGVWYEVEVRSGARLDLPSVVAFGPHGQEPVGHLQVRIESVDGDETHRVDSGRAASFPLGPGPVRLALFALPSGDANNRADQTQHEEAVGLILRRPAIVGGE